MEIQLTATEIEELQAALLSAFPGRGTLQQVVFFAVERQLSQIVTDGPDEDVVFRLVVWANANNKVVELVAEARKRNCGNVKLKAFAEKLRARVESQAPPPPACAAPLPPALRARLVDTLVGLSVTAEYLGRSSLLIGVAGQDSFNRSQNIRRLDLEMIVDQTRAHALAPPAVPPLMTVIDNASQYLPPESLFRRELAAIRAEVKSLCQGGSDAGAP